MKTIEPGMKYVIKGDPDPRNNGIEVVAVKSIGWSSFSESPSEAINLQFSEVWEIDKPIFWVEGPDNMEQKEHKQAAIYLEPLQMSTPGDVFVILVEDRHCDTDAIVFLRENDAIAHAAELVTEYCRLPEHLEDPHLNENMIKDGWVFCQFYSSEGDHIRVLRRKIQ